jgi:hypothetical protein
LSFLGPSRLCIIERVCKSWQRISHNNDSVLWRSLLRDRMAIDQQAGPLYNRSFSTPAAAGVVPVASEVLDLQPKPLLGDATRGNYSWKQR